MKRPGLGAGSPEQIIGCVWSIFLGGRSHQEIEGGTLNSPKICPSVALAAALNKHPARDSRQGWWRALRWKKDKTQTYPPPAAERGAPIGAGLGAYCPNFWELARFRAFAFFFIFCGGSTLQFAGVGRGTKGGTAKN